MKLIACLLLGAITTVGVVCWAAFQPWPTARDFGSIQRVKTIKPVPTDFSSIGYGDDVSGCLFVMCSQDFARARWVSLAYGENFRNQYIMRCDFPERTPCLYTSLDAFTPRELVTYVSPWTSDIQAWPGENGTVDQATRYVNALGWPYLAACFTMTTGWPSTKSDGLDLYGEGRGTRDARDPVILPLHVLPIGFTLNTIAYSAAWALLGSTLIAIFRRLRRPAWACTHCGYDLRGLPFASVCPECGRENLAPPAPKQAH